MSASGLIIIGSMMLAAEFIFGIAMVSKARRSEKANNAEKENDSCKKVMIPTSAVMLTPLLAFCVAIACVGCRSDKTEDSTSGTATGTTTTEETTEAATTTTTQTTTTTEATTTTTATTTVPLSELTIHGKGNSCGFYCQYYSDNSIIIDGVITISLEGVPSYQDINGTDVTNVIIPREGNDFMDNIRPIRTVFIDAYGWAGKGIKSISVPEGMTFIDSYYPTINEISFDEASTLFSQYGITLSTY